MTDAIDAQNLGSVIDFVEDPIHANSNTPIVAASNQFPAAGRTWIVRQLSNRGN
ncbi:MAG: hypothetical protein V7609_1024 [Verrucomicrobiota bacterium]